MDKKEVLFRKYCGSINDRIAACKDKNVVELLKERICWEFKQARENDVSLDVLKIYLDELISDKFNKN